MISVSQWEGETDNDSGEIGDIAYVSLFAAKEKTKLIILGTNSVGDWHRYGQSRLRATETIHSASSGRTHHLPTAIDDDPVVDDVGMYQIDDPQSIVCPFIFFNLTCAHTNLHAVDFSHHRIVCHMYRPGALAGYRKGPFC